MGREGTDAATLLRCANELELALDPASPVSQTLALRYGAPAGINERVASIARMWRDSAALLPESEPTQE